MKEKKEKTEKELKTKKKEKKKNNKKIKKDKKEKKTNKFIQTIKKKWLIDGTKTTILVLLILAVFFAISFAMQKWDLTPIDLSKDKLYTLTEESKEKVKNIDKDINIYFVGFSEDDSTLDLAKQYSKANERIKVENVSVENRPDLAEKYGFQNGDTGIIVECGEKSKILSSSDLVTYDQTTYQTISIAEEKLTSSIQSVSTDEVPKVYFLTGYSDFSLSQTMQYLNIYLQNEVNEIENLDILTTGKVPDDCDTLVINTPSSDFDEITTNAIIDYINSGRNILWMNAVVATEQNFPNVNKILAMYGVNPFEVGGIRETDASKMVYESPDLIIPETSYHQITEDITNGLIFLNATKINLVDDTALEELKVEKTEILNTSEGSYFRSNFYNSSSEKSDEDEAGPFLVGVELDKTITEANEETGEQEKVSKLIIYGDNYFASDVPLSSSTQAPLIQYRQNKDLILNSIAYLSNREEDISARKDTGAVTYTATEQENQIILTIIFAVPVIIIIIGIIVWISRQRKGAKGNKEKEEKKNKKAKKNEKVKNK